MRKVIGIVLLLVSMVILSTAMNRSFMNRLKQDRYFNHLDTALQNDQSLYHRLFVRSDRWAYGDLYGECYLPQYKLKLAPFKKYPYNASKPRTNKVLYITGDSFLADKTLTTAFKEFDNVNYLDLRFPFGPIVLDSTKQNYMLLEFAERNLNGYTTTSTSEAKWQPEDIKAKYNYGRVNNKPATPYQPESIVSRINKIIFNPDLSRNLELLLFDDNIFTPVKELKAWLNYSLLKRTNKDVIVSTDRKRLLMTITVDTLHRESAFKHRSDAYIDSITANLDKARSYYKSIGFKDVFLSIIPNPVSVYDNRRMPYNQLLQRVEKQTHLPKISVYNIFRLAPQNMYYLSDSHWNPLGFETWVTEANIFFDQEIK